MAEDRMGAQRARVVEGEIERLRRQLWQQRETVNRQGRALQACGDALFGFVKGQLEERRALECRIERLELWPWQRWALAVVEYCRPTWEKVRREQGPPVVEEADALTPASVDALEARLGTSVRPMPGDEELLREVAAELVAERLAREAPADELEADPADSFEASVGKVEAADDEGGNVRPFRGKVAMSEPDARRI